MREISAEVCVSDRATYFNASNPIDFGAVRKVTNDRNLKAEGKAEKKEGKVQQKIGHAKEDVANLKGQLAELRKTG